MVSIFGAATITLSHKEAQKAQRDSIKSICAFCAFCGYLYLLGVEMLTSIFCDPPPPNIRPLNINNPTSMMSTKIITIATTPTLPLPPPSSAMKDSSLSS
jgi:hypothetical protein